MYLVVVTIQKSTINFAWGRGKGEMWTGIGLDKECHKYFKILFEFVDYLKFWKCANLLLGLFVVVHDHSDIILVYYV